MAHTGTFLLKSLQTMMSLAREAMVVWRACLLLHEHKPAERDIALLASFDRIDQTHAAVDDGSNSKRPTEGSIRMLIRETPMLGEEL